MINSDDVCDRCESFQQYIRIYDSPYKNRECEAAASSFHGVDDNLSTGPARCGPTLEPAGFQELEPLDLLAGVINCTSFN